MIPAPVGHQCPQCVADARREFREGPARRIRSLGATSATRVLLISIAVVFVVELAIGGIGGGGAPSARALVDMGALVPVLVHAGQWWRLITVMFLHASILHIALNAWALWLFGQFVEGTFGRGRFLLIYFVSGFLASVSSYTFGNPCAVGVGASGAIVGLLGAFIAYNFRRRHLAVSQAYLRWAALIIVINILFGAAIANVDNWAHGGGLVAGLFAGTFAEGVGPSQMRPWIRIVGFAALLAIGVVIAVVRSATFPAVPCF
jgi:rhomboid protease GluP